MRMRYAMGLLLLGACTSSSEDTDAAEVPDVTGRYNLVLIGTNGCDNNTALIDTWATGPLTITGEPGATTYDFEEDVILEGSVASSGVGATSFQMGGVTTVDPHALEIYASGVVYSEDDRWVLEGDFDVQASNGVQAEDCTITGPFKAYQVSN